MILVATSAPLAFADPIAAARRGSDTLAAAAVLLILLMAPTGAALMVDDRLFNGINVWIKPLKFQASLALHLLTVAWALLLLPSASRRSRTVRVVTLAMAAAALLEVLYIGWQASQGAASHYNDGTAFTRAMYSLMGVGAVILVGGAVIVGALILHGGDRRDPLTLGVGLGLVLGGFLGGVTGGIMSTQAGHWVGGGPSDAGGLPIVGWSRTGGDWRVAHFFGLHLMQALPLAGLLLRGWPIRRARLALAGAAVAGVAVTALTLWQAAQGRPLLPL